MTPVSVATQPVVLDRLWAPQHHPLSRSALSVIMGVLVLWLSAKVQIPFYPVPLTLQPLVVLGLGFTLGPTLGLSTIAAYLAVGALGLPVFAGTPEKGLGIAYMMGPTGGYLLGFMLATWVCGMLAQRGWDRRVGSTIIAMLLGNLAIYLPGVIWLGTLIGWDKPVLALGVYPFLLGDVVKALLAAFVFPTVWRWFLPNLDR